MKIPRQPEKIEPPYGIGEKFAEYKGPGLPHGQQAAPRYTAPDGCRYSFIEIAVDMLELYLAELLFPRRDLIGEPPKAQPDKTQGARYHKTHLPAIGRQDKRYHDGRYHRSDVGAGIKDTRSQRPLFLGEPFRHRLDR